MKKILLDQFFKESQRLTSTVEEPSFQKTVDSTNYFQSILDFELLLYIFSFLKLEICFPNDITEIWNHKSFTSKLISTCFGKFKNNANQIRIRQFFFHFKIYVFSPTQCAYLFYCMDICQTLDLSLFYPSHIKKGNHIFDYFSAKTIPPLEEYTFLEPFFDNSEEEIEHYQTQLQSSLQQIDTWTLFISILERHFQIATHPLQHLSIFIPSLQNHSNELTMNHWFDLLSAMKQLKRLDMFCKELLGTHPLLFCFFPSSLEHVNLHGSDIVYYKPIFSWFYTTTTTNMRSVTLQLCNVSPIIESYLSTLFQNHRLKELTITSDSDMVLAICCESLKSNSSLTFFGFHQCKSKTLLKRQFQYKPLLELKYCHVTTLKLSGFLRVPTSLWSHFFHRLSKNTTIQNVVLENTNIMEENVEFILELLQCKQTIYQYVQLQPNKLNERAKITLLTWYHENNSALQHFVV